jgi:hypothetical protein
LNTARAFFLFVFYFLLFSSASTYGLISRSTQSLKTPSPFASFDWLRGDPHIMKNWIVMFFALASLGLRAQAQTYQVIIYQPPAGFVETQGESIAGAQRVGAARVNGGVYPEYTHAFLWTGNSINPVDLNPPEWLYSRAWATDGTRQVGYVERPGAGRYAALWNGTAGSFILLLPVGGYTTFSEALAIAGDQQVGFADYSYGGGEGGYTYIIHAALWRGTPESYVDLHPTLPGANDPGDQRSKAFGTDGTTQVGYTEFSVPLGGGQYTSETRAVLWHGTAQSVVILHPTGWETSYAYGVKNGTQVGYGIQINGDTPAMALVWHGTVQSLHILGQGTALDTNGVTHVGGAPSGYSSHAFRWDGDTGAGFDLHTLLPAGYINSGASDIDDAGNIIGWAQAQSGYLVGVLWSTNTPNTPPTVSLTSPTSNSAYGLNRNILLKAVANDVDGRVRQVEFFVNGKSVGVSRPISPQGFQMYWRASSTGSYRIEARATDNGGAATMSAPVTIKVSHRITK